MWDMWSIWWKLIFVHKVLRDVNLLNSYLFAKSMYTAHKLDLVLVFLTPSNENLRILTAQRTINIFDFQGTFLQEVKIERL
jgi:hypothetical protein